MIALRKRVNGSDLNVVIIDNRGSAFKINLYNYVTDNNNTNFKNLNSMKIITFFIKLRQNHVSSEEKISF